LEWAAIGLVWRAIVRRRNTITAPVLNVISPDFRLLRFATARFAAAQRLPAWSAIIAAKLLQMHIVYSGKKTFHVNVMLRALHEIRIATGEIGESISTRTADIVAADNDDLFMLISLDGKFSVTYGAAKINVQSGDAVFFSCTQELAITAPETIRVLALRIPFATLARYGSPRDLSATRLIPRLTSNLTLLVRYASTLFEDDDIAMTPGAAMVVVEHIVDLVALTLGGQRDAAEWGAPRDEAARLRLIKADILRNLTWRDLSVGRLANRHGLSTRQLYRLFERGGETFAEFVLEQRLAAAHRMMLGPRFADHSISAVALQCGFGDISYFNRSFRAKYGMTPSAVRTAATQGGES
jgi:AraC-like DNA-binding protein